MTFDDEARVLLARMSCHCFGDKFEPYAFGESPKFIGCRLYRSDDKEEYCLGCEAIALLLKYPAPGGTP